MKFSEKMEDHGLQTDYFFEVGVIIMRMKIGTFSIAIPYIQGLLTVGKCVLSLTLCDFLLLSRKLSPEGRSEREDAGNAVL